MEAVVAAAAAKAAQSVAAAAQAARACRTARVDLARLKPGGTTIALGANAAVGNGDGSDEPLESGSVVLPQLFSPWRLASHRPNSGSPFLARVRRR